MKDKTYNYVYNNILERVLELSESPSQFAEYLSLQIRELIGAKTIAIFVNSVTGDPKIMSVFPPRRERWASQAALHQLAGLSFGFDKTRYLNSSTSDEEVLGLQKVLEIEESIVIPLIAANKVVGSIMLLGIMDNYGIDAIINLLTQLSGVFALIIRNSSLYQNLEVEVALRTKELQKSNEELSAREKELQKINQELTIAKEKAEESDRLKSAFLANMSHEIRTPMNGILGFSSLLKEPGLSGEEQQEYIRIIEKSGDRMLNIINDLISISKIESGQMEISTESMNINQQFNFLNDFFKHETKQKGLIFCMRCPLPDNKVSINTDKEKFVAILINLIKNSIKYTNNGSIEFGYEFKGDHFEFYVKDTGIGIPKNKQQMIFNRFVQVDSSISSGYEGAGLGLSITKAYVEMLGGSIWLDSEIGKGTIFFFTIPVHKVPEIELAPQMESAIATEGITDGATILVAEDDVNSSKFITHVLKKLHSKVILAQTGEEAVELCRNNPQIDLVLMDIKMPVMDGHTATKLIKVLQPNLPIIAQSAYALDTEIEIYGDIFDGYITKPINADELKQKVKQYVRNT